MDSIKRLSFSLITTILLPTYLCSQIERQSFDWNEWNKRSTHLSNLQFSPDGNYLLYTTRNADFNSNRWITKYHLLNKNTQEDTTLEFEQEGVRAAKWSPSGRYFSFIATKDGISQLFIQEYASGEIKTITNHHNDILSHSWSHDESRIALVSRDLAEEKEESEKFLTAFEVGAQGYLDTQPYLPSHLHMFYLDSGEVERLTEGTRSISSDISWSPDDKKLVFSMKMDAFPARWHESKIMFYHFENNSLTALSDKTNFEYDPWFTPQGNHLLYGHKADGNPAGLTDLFVQYENGTTKNLSLSIDRNLKSYSWLYPDDAIVAFGQDGTKDGVWIISLSGKVKEVPYSNTLVITDLAVNKEGEMAIIASSGDQPSEIFYLKDYRAAPVQFTRYNQPFKNMKLGKVETITWKTDLGIEADGVVTYPPGFTPNQKYPLILYIHGGPTGSSVESFNPVAQAMASNGWIIFQPNYRGSNNRGDQFQEAIMNDGGEGPGRDVMAGIETLKQRGNIEESRIGVSGWSYGGFMTTWLIGRYPNAWKVAVAGAPPIDFTDMTSLSRMNLTLRHAITNSPWIGENYQLHHDMSPLRYLPDIKTPTLIMSKVEDQVVSVTGSYKLYHALLANDIPVKFIAYPGGGHFPSDPVNRKDVTDRWIKWLKDYMD